MSKTFIDVNIDMWFWIGYIKLWLLVEKQLKYSQLLSKIFEC